MDYILDRHRARAMIGGLWPGTLSRLNLRRFLPSDKPTEYSIRAFFKKYRATPQDQDIADASSGIFFNELVRQIEQLGDGFDTIVDLGCGSAPLRLHQVATSRRYIGIDLYISSIATNANHHLIEQAVSGSIDIARVRGNRAVFVSMNLLCYMKDVTPFTDFVSRNCRSGDALLIFEPAPSLIWETYFYGISIFLRSCRELKAIVAKMNFQTADTGGIFLGTILGTPQFRIIRIVHARKP